MWLSKKNIINACFSQNTETTTSPVDYDQSDRENAFQDDFDASEPQLSIPSTFAADAVNDKHTNSVKNAFALLNQT